MKDIEKVARLMGYEIAEKFQNDVWVYMDEHKVYTVPFNPRTNKADLMDVEIEFNLDVMNTMCDLEGNYLSVYYDGEYGVKLNHEKYADHPTKFTARAEAVLSVVSQIYDAKYGKDGE